MAITYKIVEQEAGRIYCIVTREDGSTFGQVVDGNARTSIAGIEQLLVEAEERFSAPKAVEQEVQDMIRDKTSRVLVIPVRT